MKALHTLLWAPLEGALAHCRRVLVVPHAELATLPFAALTDGARTLDERLLLALAPSARIAIRGLRGSAAAPRAALVVGVSDRLPHARTEAQAVAAIYAHSRVLLDTDATLPALREHARDADVLHFACHAQYRCDNPMFSALHLADGALSAETIETLSLDAGLVVLGACETALADHERGDDHVGLVRAFLVAGAARVVASLWPVDDAVTAAFMLQFHAALARGTAPAGALACAQRELRRTHPHPGHWAAFTLYGGW
jgi:CHAT domain-containing protein